MNCLVFRLCENAPELLREVCEELGWREFEEEDDEDEDWNLWWKTSGFRTSDFDYCRPWQRLNHFPKSSLITRKDSLARNLRRMRGIYGSSLYNFAPMAFNLPNDYKKFVAEYSKQKKGQRNLWICKPADQSRGRGIFLFRELNDLTYNCATVVQKYIPNPLLISGYKFDLRLYVLVTSFNPFCVYIYHEGLVRFSTEKFDLTSTDNVFSHLTNTSINKFGPSYSTEKDRVGVGCKWSLSQLRIYFHQHSVDDRLLWHKISSIIVLTLLMQAPEVPRNRSNCFELFGFDVLIDENMKPWLLEVNFSPSLGNDCPLDVTIKKPMLNDLMQALKFTDADSLRDTTKKPKSGSKSEANRKKTPIKPLVSRSLKLKDFGASRLKTQAEERDSNYDSRLPDVEGDVSESDACLDVNSNFGLPKIGQGKGDVHTDEGGNCFYINQSKNACITSMVEGDSTKCDGSEAEDTKTTSVVLLSNSKLHLSKTRASCQFIAAFGKDNPNEPMESRNDTVFEPSQSTEISWPNGGHSSSQVFSHKPLRDCENNTFPENLTKQETPRDFTNNNNCSIFDKDTSERRTSTGRQRRVSSLRSQKSHVLLPLRTAGHMMQRSLSTTPRRISFSSNPLDLLTPRSFADRLCPRFPSKRQNAANHKEMRPMTQFGNYILAFPFSESTYKASQGDLNTKVIAQEIRTTLKMIGENIQIAPKAKDKKEGSEQLNLGKTFWGFRPMYSLHER